MRRLFKGLFRSAGDAQANLPKIRVGVCAMDKKARSKPMKEILERLTAWGEFEVIIFGDEAILDKPTEDWPHVECLLCWHSDGFPLKKAQEYILNRRPFLVNDVFMQDALLDRRRVYKILVEKNIPVPTHILVDREGLPEGTADPPGFVEDEDFVELNGQRIYKPFVEKPVSGEDHNIWVYYPHSMGGGVKYLFRKVDDKASKYDSEHDGRVRRDGSYIYEEFLPTGGTDVKVYTVGPRYAHAEARKSPVVDGKVLRSADGKEMRFPVLLSPQEKEIARMVCLAFGQKVCGFDLLRSEKGRSYVCDVNGWSFVKNSKKYYDDAAGILRSIILSALAPHRLNVQPHLPAHNQGLTNPETGSAVVSDDDDDDDSLVPGMDVSEVRHTDKRSQKEELRCVLAVIRHGDRTPKQKLKIVITQEPLLALFHRHKDAKGKQAKLKSPLQLQELLDTTRQLVKDFERRDDEREGGSGPMADEEREMAQEVRGKLRILQTVLESGGQFSGINRKVQIKPLRWSVGPNAAGAGSLQPQNSVASDGQGGGAAAGAGGTGQLVGGGPSADLGAAQGSTGAGSEQQVASPTGAAASASGGGGTASGSPAPPSQAQAPVLEEALLILKWGGVLTHAGRQQAEDLGKIYRMVMYPSGGNGLLRLHSTYRHDLKIYSSDEGRVQTSAAAFTKAMLDLEGSSLTPILVSLVNKDASMLEAFGKGASDDIAEAKEALYQAMTWDPEKPNAAPLAVSKLSQTPMISPPLSPKISRNSSFITSGDRVSATAVAPPAAGAAADGSAPAAAKPPGGPGKLPMLHVPQPGDLGGGGGGGMHSVASAGAMHTVGSGASLTAMPSFGGGAGGQGVSASGMAGPAPPNVMSVLQRMMDRIAALKAAAREQLAKEQQQRAAEELLQQQQQQAQQEKEEKAKAQAAAAAAAAQAAAQAQAAAGEDGKAQPAAGEQAQEDGSPVVAEAEAATPTEDAAQEGAPADAGPLSPAVPAESGGKPPQAPVPTGKPPRPSPLGKRSLEHPYAAAGSQQQHTLLRPGSPHNAAIVARLPDTPLGLLRRLVELLRQLEDRLRQLVRDEGDKWRNSAGPSKYSSLSMDPKERVHEEGQPCGGEKMLLMFDRWHKLLKSFYSEKKDRFDISKVPDIYDSAKYDAIHNAHLGLEVLEELYIVAKLLADVVIPCEYGLDPAGKLKIGGKIANELLGKLMVDLASMREESMATAAMAGAASGAAFNYDQLEGDVGRISLQDEAMVKHGMGPRHGPASAVSSSRGGGGGPAGRDAELESGGGGGGGGDIEAAETETIHRLCPTYASDINSPLRHVRTRIYFTSESHMHSLVNVLRYCHLGADVAGYGVLPPVTPPSGTGGTSSPDLRASAGGANSGEGPVAAAVASAFGRAHMGAAAAAAAAAASGDAAPPSPMAGAAAGGGCFGRQFDSSPLLGEQACAQVDMTTELDYLTQVVFRMYENKTVPVDSPERFRVEVLFSPGANYNPFEVLPPHHSSHVLPTIPRTALHKGEGITLAEMEEKLLPFSQTRKFNTCSYALQYSLRAPPLGGQGSRYGSVGMLGHAGRSTASMPGNDSQGDMSKAVAQSMDNKAADKAGEKAAEKAGDKGAGTIAVAAAADGGAAAQ